MGNELFDHHLLCSLLTDGDGFGIGDDYFLEVVDVVAIYVVALLDLADRDLGKSIATEYSSDRPYKVSPYTTLWVIYLGRSSGVSL